MINKSNNRIRPVTSTWTRHKSLHLPFSSDSCGPNFSLDMLLSAMELESETNELQSVLWP